MSSEPYNPSELLRIKTVRELASLLPRVVKLWWQVSPLLITLVAIIAVAAALVDPAVLFLTKVIVDIVHQNLGQAMQWTLVIVPLGVIFGLWIANGLVGGITRVIEQLLSERTYNTTLQKLLHKASKLDLAFFEAPKFYDQLQQADLNQGFVQVLPMQLFHFLQQLLSLGAMVGLLSLLHPLAFLLLVATVLPRLLLEGHMTRLGFKLGSELARNFRRTDYMQTILTDREKAKEIRIFGLGSFFFDRFLKFRSEYVSAHIRQMLHFMGYNLGLGTLTTLGIGAVSIFAVIQAVRGDISIGTLTLVFSAAQQIVSLIGGVIGSLNSVYQSSLSSSRYFELLDLDPQSISGALQPPRVAEPRKAPLRIRKGIELESVSFTYPATDVEVLKDISFSLPAGSRVAIVGENGAGKTTLVKLLARFYDPAAGAIKLDGLDYRDYELNSLRESISVVFQDFAKYDISVAENIGVGSIEEIDNRDRIVKAASNSGTDTIVARLPNGYDTVLGKTMDEGVDLSGGEWQHIAIARAFMSDSPLLILDEPTAALDSLRERELYERIARLASSKTVVFVSHRFSTVRMADLIVVIDDGKSVEVGSHAELLSRKGKYYRMFETQAARYR